MKAFQSFHPSVVFGYFAVTLLFTMFTAHPVLIALSLVGAVSFCATLQRGTDFWKNLAFYLPLMLVASLFNPLFVHNGKTPLFFLNGNAVTLEAIAYGGCFAVTVVAVMYWFKCYNFVMTSDKFLYLFGKIIPKAALLLSSALAFVPRFKRQFRRTSQAMKTMGMYSPKSRLDRLKNTLKVFAATLARSLESAVETGDSMRARGYGLKGRTHYGIFKITPRDVVLLAALAAWTAAIAVGFIGGAAAYSFYPTFSAIGVAPQSIALYALFAVLCLFPAICEITEKFKWKYYASKI